MTGGVLKGVGALLIGDRVEPVSYLIRVSAGGRQPVRGSLRADPAVLRAVGKAELRLRLRGGAEVLIRLEGSPLAGSVEFGILGEAPPTGP